MSGTQRVEASGWTLAVSRARDDGGIRPIPPPDPEAVDAAMADLLPLLHEHDGTMRVAVTAPGEPSPSLVVRLGYQAGAGFGADALLVPETGRVFVGGGTRMICYARTEGRWWRQWEREVEGGVWGLARHGPRVLMRAELELAAWTLDGEFRWSTWVEPPWGCEVEGDRVTLNVMGREAVLDLASGAVVAGRVGPGGGAPWGGGAATAAGGRRLVVAIGCVALVLLAGTLALSLVASVVGMNTVL